VGQSPGGSIALPPEQHKSKGDAMTKTQRLQAENDRLRAALAAIVEICQRERRELAEWPRAVGQVQYLACEALKGGHDDR